MSTRIKRQLSSFLLITPILILFGLGILVTSEKKVTPITDEASACGVSSFGGEFDPSAKLGFFDGEQISVPTNELAKEDVTTQKDVLGEVNPSNKWIEIILGQQTLKAWDNGQLYLQTPISSGLSIFPTPIGEFTIWLKERYVHMVGGVGRYAYDLPNVPYVMFFQNSSVPGYKGYSLHGTYWHHDFGKPHSHGCVNLPTDIAAKLYYWTNPELPAGKSSVLSATDNPGTRIVIEP